MDMQASASPIRVGGKGANGHNGSVHVDVAGIEIQFDLLRCQQLWGGMPAVTMWAESSLAGLMLGLHRMVGTQRFNLALQSGGRDSIEGDWAFISRYPTFEEGFAALAEVANAAGWGGWELLSIDRERHEAVFRVRSSWEALYQRALGVCWGSSMIAGKFAGLCARLFGENCWAEQTRFAARGDEVDELRVRPSDRTVEGELDHLLETDEATRADLAVAMQQLRREVDERRIAEEALRQSEQEKLALIAQQQQTIVTMSTPIIQVWRGVLSLPITGALDAERAAEIMEKLLQRIVEAGARAAIIDVTGVESVDAQTAEHLVRIARAIELLGARAVVTGIRPSVAQAIVAIGADLASLATVATMEEGLKLSWQWMGLAMAPVSAQPRQQRQP